MIHVGIDLHHRNSYVRALTGDGELVPGQRIYHSHIDALRQYLAAFGDQDQRVVFEATSNARWFKRLLAADPSVEAVAGNPRGATGGSTICSV